MSAVKKNPQQEKLICWNKLYGILNPDEANIT